MAEEVDDCLFTKLKNEERFDTEGEDGTEGTGEEREAFRSIAVIMFIPVFKPSQRFVIPLVRRRLTKLQTESRFSLVI